MCDSYQMRSWVSVVTVSFSGLKFKLQLDDVLPDEEVRLLEQRTRLLQPSARRSSWPMR